MDEHNLRARDGVVLEQCLADGHLVALENKNCASSAATRSKRSTAQRVVDLEGLALRVHSKQW